MAIVVLSCSSLKAQNLMHQSQYMHHMAFINPAQIVTYNSLNAALFHKSQWVGFSGAPTMQGLSIGKSLPGFKSSWNAQVLHDKIGVNNTFHIGGTYAYKLQLNERVRLGMALGAYMNMAQSNFADVETTVTNDPVYQENTKAQIMPNFKFGAHLYTPEYFIGFALPNLLRNQVIYDGSSKGETSFDISSLHAYFNAGYHLELSRDLMFTPSILVKHISGAPVQLDINANAEFSEKAGVGLSYRTSQEVVMMASYRINEEFLIGYSYDVGFSDLSIFSSGSHEIMLTYKVRSSINPDKPVIKEEDIKPRIEI